MTAERDQTAIDVFAQAVHGPLAGAGAQYQHGPMGGHEWHWADALGRRWALNVGGAIDVGPLFFGPDTDNRWQLAAYTLRNADLVVTMLQLAGAIPAPVGRPTPGPAHSTPAPRVDIDAIDQGAQVRRTPGARLAGVDQVAGSDLPPRDQTRPRPSPTGAPIGDGKPTSLRELSERLYSDRPAEMRPGVLGGGGPAEYGSDGVAYEGDRVPLQPVDRTVRPYGRPVDNPGWRRATPRSGDGARADVAPPE